MSDKKQTQGESTRAVHAGRTRQHPYHALTQPIVQTSNYTFENSQTAKAYVMAHHAGETERLEYGRYGNPTVRAVEKRLAALENGEDAILMASGMAAITTSLLTFLSAGDHILITDDCYRRTRELTTGFLKKFGVACDVVPMNNFDALKAAIQPNTRIILSESPTNPYLRVMDLGKLAEITREANILTLVDATFATPLNLQPLSLGIDLVIHSTTKYLAGHNDLLGGVVIGSQRLIDTIRTTCGIIGPTVDPQNAFLTLRGIKTLGLRVRHQNTSAKKIASFLESHPAVEKVYYPGMPSHPDHDIAAKLMTGFGGVVSFCVHGDLSTTSAFIDRLMIPFITPSLGGTESLVIQPALMTYFHLSQDEREKIGIEDNLIRFAVGLEDPDDLIADLQQALDSMLANED